MPKSRLPNYLRAYRKQLGLDQREIAFLLSEQDGSSVSRHEFFKQEPNLRSALAYEAILGKPVAELFRGIADDERTKVAERVRILIERIEGGSEDNNRRRRKTDALNRLLKELASSNE